MPAAIPVPLPLVPERLVKTVVTSAVQKDLQRFSKIKVVDDASCRAAEGALLFAVKVKNALLKVCLPFVRNAKAHYDAQKAERATMVAPFLTLESNMRAQVTTFRTAQERSRHALEVSLVKKAAQLPAGRYTEQVDGEDVIFDTPATSSVAVTVAAAETSIPTFEYWFGTVVDARALLKGILDGDVPADIITIEQSAINRYAAEQKRAMRWPGVEVEMEIRPIAAER